MRLPLFAIRKNIPVKQNTKTELRNKMPVTMENMELVYADLLTPDQLMEEDIIEIDNDIVTVLGIDSDATGDTYYVGYVNDYGDRDVAEYNYTDTIKLYVFREEPEDI
jgi:hypothetical protein